MSLSLNITVSLQAGQSLTRLMNTAGPSCSTDPAHIKPLWGNFISPATAVMLSTDTQPGVPFTPGVTRLLWQSEGLKVSVLHRPQSTVTAVIESA